MIHLHVIILNIICYKQYMVRLGFQREDPVHIIFEKFHTCQLYYILPVLNFKSHLGENVRLNYQDPDSGVLYSSGYGVRGIYIYIYSYHF